MARTITPKIDARLFTAQMNAKEKARCNIRQYIPIGAIKGNFWDDAPAPGMYYDADDVMGGAIGAFDAPAPGMYYDADINMWWPESFKLEKMEIIEEDTQRIIDTAPDEEREGYSVNGKQLVPYVSVITEWMNARKNIEENPAREVQQVHCDTGTPIASNQVSVKEEKATDIPKSARTTSRSRMVDMVPPVEPISIPEPIVPIEESKPTVEPQPEAVEQSKNERVCKALNLKHRLMQGRSKLDTDVSKLRGKEKARYKLTHDLARLFVSPDVKDWNSFLIVLLRNGITTKEKVGKCGRMNLYYCVGKQSF